MLSQQSLYLWITICLTIACSFPAAGQQDSVYQLILGNNFDKEVLTTNRSTPENTNTAPANTIIINNETIQKRNYQSLLDVLYDLPDFKVDYAVDPRWMHDVSIRGIRGMDRFIILLDGVRISSPTNDIIPVMENYPVNMAKRIEVVYGPASALYGADAFAGVINIITKEIKGKKIHHNTSVSGGMYGTYIVNSWVGANINKKVQLTAGGQYFRDNQPKLWEFYKEDYEGIESLETGTFNSIFGPMSPTTPFGSEPKNHELSAFAFNVNLKISELKLTYFVNQSHNPSTTAQNPNNAVYNQEALFGHRINMLNLLYDKKLSKKVSSKTYLTGSFYRLDPESNFRNVFTGLNPAYLFSLGRMYKTEEIIYYEANNRFNLTGGVTYESFFSRPRGHDLQHPPRGTNPKGVIVNSIYSLNPDGIEADLPEVKYNNFGGFVQAKFIPNEKLSFTIGARLDNNSRFGSTFNPRLGLVWHPSKHTTFKALYGSAFLAPSPLAAYDQFGTFVSDDDGENYLSLFMRLPNPDLDPQLIDTFEFSLRQLLKINLSLSITGYYSRISGLFEFTEDTEPNSLHQNNYKGWPVAFVEITVNQGTQKNYGGTIQLDYLKSIGDTKSVKAYMALSIVEGKVDNDENGPNPPVEIPSITPFIFRSGFDLKLNKFGISPRIIITGKQRVFTPQLEQVGFDPISGDSIFIPKEKRQIIDGFVLLNINAYYNLKDHFQIFLTGKNMLDQRYYNVNLGAAPEGSLQGAANAEFRNGAPQNPIRIIGGLRINF